MSSLPMHSSPGSGEGEGQGRTAGGTGAWRVVGVKSTVKGGFKVVEVFLDGLGSRSSPEIAPGTHHIRTLKPPTIALLGRNKKS